MHRCSNDAVVAGCHNSSCCKAKCMTESWEITIQYGFSDKQLLMPHEDVGHNILIVDFICSTWNYNNYYIEREVFFLSDNVKNLQSVLLLVMVPMINTYFLLGTFTENNKKIYSITIQTWCVIKSTITHIVCLGKVK